jgi:hypothetical protein
VMPHALYGGGGEHVTMTRVSFHRRQRVLEIDRKSFSEYGIQTSARTSARVLGTERKESCRWKLFHREERPTLERNIIDTSERARASYRYVIGQHFGL